MQDVGVVIWGVGKTKFQLRKWYLKVAGVGKRKTLACLGNYGSFSVAELWRARK